jgi:hypothetical protein
MFKCGKKIKKKTKGACSSPISMVIRLGHLKFLQYLLILTQLCLETEYLSLVTVACIIKLLRSSQMTPVP